MRNVKLWLVATVLAAALGGTAVATYSATARAAPVPADHWRYFDGHWSYWYAPDQRWYYTDGQHWFCHEGNAWALYKFDHHFGREAFERGEYRHPEGRFEVPRHGVFVHP